MSFIIGTAGHVDHGKSQLIKALTGTETDRLKEEKKRGITIELGFAALELPSGDTAGIVDVPGHEKFIKNMLAGAGGMDIVLLVVAADEGVMPQTREHIEILELLAVKKGIVVITKCDLCDAEWLAEIKNETAQELVGTFLQNAPILEVSSHTGQGIAELKALINSQLLETDERSRALPAQLPIDREFIMPGFGTVVTGTLLEGEIAEGDELMLYPAEALVRVRSIQVHGKAKQQAVAGQRTAINIVAQKMPQTLKGAVLAKPGSLKISQMLDVKVTLTQSCARTVENGSRLHFHYGTEATLCKINLLNAQSLSAGESAYAQLTFTQPVATKKGDRFVLRFYSPTETVGGGVVLESMPVKHKRFNQKVLEELAVKENGSESDRFYQQVYERGNSFPTVKKLAELTLKPVEELNQLLENGVKQGILLEILGKYFLHTEFLEELFKTVEKTLLDYHANNPISAGLKRDELKAKSIKTQDMALLDGILAYFEEKNYIKTLEGRIALKSFEPTYTPADEKAIQKIEKLALEQKYNLPEKNDILNVPPHEKAVYERCLSSLIENGKLIVVSEQFFIHKNNMDALKMLMQNYFEEHNAITLAQFRDLTQSTRKYALALLEYFDRRAYTIKTGNERIKKNDFLN